MPAPVILPKWQDRLFVWHYCCFSRFPSWEYFRIRTKNLQRKACFCKI